MWFVLLGCVFAGLAIFFVLVRPFTRPLEDRIPHGAQYRATSRPSDYGQRRFVRRAI